MRTTTAVPLLLLVLGSCASTPDITYYTLDMTPSGRVGSELNLPVEHFVPAESLGRSEIQIQTTPTRVEHYASARWVSGIGDQVQRKLAAEFGTVVVGRRTLVVGGRVLAFGQVDAEPAPRARVVLEVTIRAGESRRYEAPLLEKIYEAVRVADVDSADGVVQALSRAVEDIAVEIAGDAARL